MPSREPTTTGPSTPAAGCLSVVATPIGNLEDITLRALRVLKECDGILAEDTRRTRRLCTHHVIPTPLRSFHAHTPDEVVTAIVSELVSGAHLAIVTDAGTPLISDPGARLVEAATDAGVRVEPIPGPSAPIAALAVAGLHVSSFRFVGFLPRTGARRRAALEEIAASRDATILFEAPTRLPRTLRDLAAVTSVERRAVVCRELTKLHEEIARDALPALAARFAEPPRGEVTIVVEGRIGDEPVAATSQAERRTRALQLLAEGRRTKDAARVLAEELGITMREAYGLVVESSRSEDDL